MARTGDSDSDMARTGDSDSDEWLRLATRTNEPDKRLGLGFGRRRANWRATRTSDPNGRLGRVTRTGDSDE